MEKRSDFHEALETFVKDYGAPDSMMAHKNRSDQVHNSSLTFENTESMGIHQKGIISTKIQKKALFWNCARNGIDKCLEHTFRYYYGATDTHMLPRLCHLWPSLLGGCRGKLHLSSWQEKHQTSQSTNILDGMIEFVLRKTEASERPRSENSLDHCTKLDHQ